MKEKQKKEKKQDQEKETPENSNKLLSWPQVMKLMGKPLWDNIEKKWRILSGYQCILGKMSNSLFYEITFTDTPSWESFENEELYLNIPKDKEESQDNGDKGSDKKDKRAKTENEK